MHAAAQLGEGGGSLPCPFLKIGKSTLVLGGKSPNCAHCWVESSILNVVLRVSRRKSSKIFPYGVLFSVFDERFIEVP